MKRFLIFTLFGILSIPLLQAQTNDSFVESCAKSAGADAIYLQDFVVDQISGTKPQTKFTMLLKKNVRYRFTICNASPSSGKAVLNLYDESRLMGSTYIASTGKEYPGFDFPCTKTGVYHLFIEFRDNKPGKAVAILSYVESK